MPIITLTTDFGLKDPFIGIMKGVILSICPQARIVDLSHELNFANIRQAAFILEASHKYFPPDSIHIAVVDPGVGGARRGLAALTERGLFIAPDNGLLSRIFKLYPAAEIRSLENRKLMLDPVSSTFHGRDVFAPIAAHLCSGAEFSSVGPRIEDPMILEVEDYEVTGNTVRAFIIHIDRFGNIITSIPADFKHPGFSREFKLSLAGGDTVKLVKTYESLPHKELGMIPGSSGCLEIALNRDSAALRTGAEVGDEFTIEFLGLNK